MATIFTPVSATLGSKMSPIATGAITLKFFNSSIIAKILSLGMSDAVLQETIGEIPFLTGIVEVTIRVGFVISFLAL